MSVLKNIKKGWATSFIGLVLVAYTLYSDFNNLYDSWGFLIRIAVGVLLLICPPISIKNTFTGVIKGFTGQQSQHNYPHYDHYKQPIDKLENNQQ